MDEQSLKQMIRMIIEDLLAPKKALVLFTGALMGADEAITALAALKRGGLAMDWVQTKTAACVLDQSAIATIGATSVDAPAVSGYNLLIVPTLTANIAAKAAHGVADCLASNLMAGFFKSGVPVVLARDGACPDGPLSVKYDSIPTGYAAMMRANLSILAGFGAVVTSAKHLYEAVTAVRFGEPPNGLIIKPRQFGQPDGVTRTGPGSGATIIARQTIAGLPTGSTYQVPVGARVTPSARDVARWHHITLIEEVSDVSR